MIRITLTPPEESLSSLKRASPSAREIRILYRSATGMVDLQNLRSSLSADFYRFVEFGLILLPDKGPVHVASCFKTTRTPGQQMALRGMALRGAVGSRNAVWRI